MNHWEAPPSQHHAPPRKQVFHGQLLVVTQTCLILLCFTNTLSAIYWLLPRMVANLWGLLFALLNILTVSFCIYHWFDILKRSEIKMNELVMVILLCCVIGSALALFGYFISMVSQ